MIHHKINKLANNHKKYNNHFYTNEVNKMFEDRINRNVALNDLKTVFSLLKIELTPELEAQFITKFNLKYNQVKNKIAVKEGLTKSEAAKEAFIDGINERLDQAIAFLEEFKDEEKIDKRIGSLGYAFGLILGTIQYGVSSSMMVQWEYSGDSIPLVEGIEKKFDAVMVELQRANKNIILKRISERANYLSKKHKAKRDDYGLAYNALIHIAGALQTKNIT
ncbi:MAG: hypothetical protein Q8R37_06205 [Nanoarchaeota archaeon]|nr:hypothetical protein [Nanoarchaeota archaeon]